MGRLADVTVSSWLDEVTPLVSRFVADFERRFGFPPGENRVVRVEAPTMSGPSVPDELRTLYSHVHEISLPDLVNGVFVLPWADVAEATVVGAAHDDIVVFGSDGGGGLFALSRSGRGVYRLSGAALSGSVYDVHHAGFVVGSQDLSGFLEGIRAQLLQAVA